MTLSNFTLNTEEIIDTKWLGIRPYTCHFTKFELPNFISKYCTEGYDNLGKFVLSLHSGEYIPKKHYSITETNYIYVKVGNFSKGYLDLIEYEYLEDEIGKEYENLKLEKGDIIITRSGTVVGKVSVFDIPEGFEEKIFIPSHESPEKTRGQKLSKLYPPQNGKI